MIGFSAAVSLTDEVHSVEIADGVAVLRDCDGAVLGIQTVQWAKPQTLLYRWDEPDRFDMASSLADVFLQMEMVRSEIQSLRAACDIALGEVAS